MNGLSTEHDPAGEAAIRRLLFRYAQLDDERDWDGLADLFTEDGIFVVTPWWLPDYSPASHRAADDHVYLGRDQIRSRLQTPERTGLHITSNVLTDIHPGGRTASGFAYYQWYVANEDDTFTLKSAGRYRDRYERTDEEWLFSFRKNERLGVAGLPSKVAEPLHERY